MNRTRMLMSVAALLCVTGIALADGGAQNDHDRLARDILKNLDVNSFDSSLRPKAFPQGTTLGQTPFHIVEKVQGAKATYSVMDEEKSWFYSVEVMKSDSTGVTICFIDASTQDSYLTASPLLVKKKSSDRYVVVKALKATPACRIEK